MKLSTLLKKFGKMGEKSGWTYLEIPASVATKLKPGWKKSFRVKGMIDQVPVSSLSLLPMGGGDFILPVNSVVRRKIKKEAGQKVNILFELDTKPLTLSSLLLTCLKEEKVAQRFFDALPPSHKNYYSKWIESAKTEATKVRRTSMAMKGFAKGLGYTEMMRAFKAENRILKGLD